MNYRKRLSIAFFFFLSLCGGNSYFHAQTSGGVHYYVVENLETGDVIRRGIGASAEITFTNLILPPNSKLRTWLLDSETLKIGYLDFASPESGNVFTIPRVTLGTPLAADSDRDGLDDEAEYILGTDRNLRDTDNDGIADGAEVRQGTNPLDGLWGRYEPVLSLLLILQGLPWIFVL